MSDVRETIQKRHRNGLPRETEGVRAGEPPQAFLQIEW